jgi:hypothetical protein
LDELLNLCPSTCKKTNLMKTSQFVTQVLKISS